MRRFGSVDKAIENVERRIYEWIRKHYRLKMWCSIQLMQEGQSDSRQRPCNNYCNLAYEDESLRVFCDESDLAMKGILSYRMSKGETDISIGYLCHRKVSNIVIPFYDDICTKGRYWYIFLGQFLLLPCGNNAHDVYNECFKAENIRVLDQKDMKEEYSDCIIPGVFQDPNEELSDYDIDKFTLPQLVVCKIKAIDIFSDFLGSFPQDGITRERFQEWMEYHNRLDRRMEELERGAKAFKIVNQIRDNIEQIHNAWSDIIENDYKALCDKFNPNSEGSIKLAMKSHYRLVGISQRLDWKANNFKKAAEKFLRTIRDI